MEKIFNLKLWKIQKTDEIDFFSVEKQKRKKTTFLGQKRRPQIFLFCPQIKSPKEVHFVLVVEGSGGLVAGRGSEIV